MGTIPHTETSNLNLVDLARSLTGAQVRLEKDVKQEGIFGTVANMAKENFGSSAHSTSTASRLWSHVLNSDNSYSSVLKDITSARTLMEDAARGKTHFTETGAQTFGSQIKDRVTAFESSQKSAVDNTADGLTIGLLLVSRSKSMDFGQSLIRGAIQGAIAKPFIKIMGRESTDVSGDIVSGASLGALVSSAQFVGERAATRAGENFGVKSVGALSAIQFGTEGAGIGYGQAVGRNVEALKARGESGPTAALHAVFAKSTAEGMLAGAMLGGIGGGLLSKSADSLMANEVTAQAAPEARMMAAQPATRASEAFYYRSGLRDLMPGKMADTREAGFRLALTKAGVSDYSEFASADAATLAKHNVPMKDIDELVAKRVKNM